MVVGHHLDGAGRDDWLDHPPELVDVLQLGERHSGGDRADVGLGLDETLGLEQAHRLADRDVRDVQSTAELTYVDALAGTDGSVKDVACAGGQRRSSASAGLTYLYRPSPSCRCRLPDVSLEGLDEDPAVDGQQHASDEGCHVGCEEDDRPADLVGLAQPSRAAFGRRCRPTAPRRRSPPERPAVSSSIVPSVIAAPGHTEFTRTPNGASSIASDLVNPAIACFDVV